MYKGCLGGLGGLGTLGGGEVFWGLFYDVRRFFGHEGVL